MSVMLTTWSKPAFASEETYYKVDVGDLDPRALDTMFRYPYDYAPLLDRLLTNPAWKEFRKKYGGVTMPEVKRVIFNYPATIIFWDDNTKTVVKCQPYDTYDKEKGFVMAYLKKLLGNDNTFNKQISKWVD